MRYTNKLNLPEAIIKFVNSDEHEIKPHRYSVTELLNPTRMILLYRKYYNEIVRDVSDSVPALLGTAVHGIFEKYSDPEKSEVEVEATIGEDTLAGRIDYLDLDSKTITDYKTTSCAKVVREDFSDWKMQGLMYAYLVYKTKGVIIRKLRFIALLKDWSKLRPNPTSPVYVWEYNVQDSDYDFVIKYIKDKLFEINYAIQSGVIPECTDEEKWYSGTKYAYYKRGSDKRAKAVFDKREEAEEMKMNADEGLIVTRPGECRRCMYYCDVCKFCDKLKEVTDE